MALYEAFMASEISILILDELSIGDGAREIGKYLRVSFRKNVAHATSYVLIKILLRVCREDVLRHCGAKCVCGVLIVHFLET